MDELERDIDKNADNITAANNHTDERCDNILASLNSHISDTANLNQQIFDIQEQVDWVNNVTIANINNNIQANSSNIAQLWSAVGNVETALDAILGV